MEKGRERSGGSFWAGAGAHPLIWWHSSTEATVVRVIIAAMWRADRMFRCARQEFSSSAPLSSPGKEERGTDEKLTLFNHIFFSLSPKTPAFHFLFGTSRALFRFCASEMCSEAEQNGGGVTLPWMRFKRMGTLPVTYAHHAPVRTYGNTRTPTHRHGCTHSQELTKAHSCGICASQRQKALMPCPPLSKHNWHCSSPVL